MMTTGFTIARSEDGSRAAPEAQLVALCTRPELDDRSRQEIRRILATAPDWSAIARWATWHQVVPVVRQRLERDFPACMPAELASAWEHECRTLAHDARRYLDELLALIELFSGHGISVIPYKGPALALQLYDDVGLRPCRDLDLLIRESAVEDALQLLQSRGYFDPDYTSFSLMQTAYLRRYYGQWLFRHPGLDITVEPHWSLTPWTLAASLDESGLWRRAKRTTLLGRPCFSLSPEDQLIALGTHGSKELWNRLKSLSDIARLLTKTKELDWPAMLGRARDLGVLRMVLLGLLGAHRILGARIPRDVANSISADRGLDRLVNNVASWTFYQPRVLPTLNRLCSFRIHMRERFSDRVRFVLRTVLSPSESDIRSVSLPDTLFFAYYPLRVMRVFALDPAQRIVHRLIPASRHNSRPLVQ
jgi:hypothetical protein